MNFKRISSIIVAVAMLLSIFSFNALAVGEAEFQLTYENITDPGQVIEKDDMFWATVKLVNATSLFGGQVSLNYDTSVVQLVQAAGTTATTFVNSTDSTTRLHTVVKVYSEEQEADVAAFEQNAGSIDTTNGNATYTFSKAQIDGGFTAYSFTGSLTIVKFRFKALNNGTPNFAYTAGTEMKLQTVPGGAITNPTTGITPLTIGTVGPTQYTLTADTVVNGSLSFDPAGGTYDAGTVVTVTATPNSGYKFVAFTGASTSTTSSVQITMDGNKTIGATFELIMQEQDAPSLDLFTATAPTAALNDGSISGTTTAMEYKLFSASEYMPCEGSTITGLEAGTYNIRYAAKTGYNASPAISFIVPAYEPPVTDSQIKMITPATPIKQGDNAVVEVKVKNIPNTSSGVGFGIDFNADVLEVITNGIVGSDKVNYSMGDVTVSAGTLGFAGTFVDSLSFDEEVLVATITFKVKTNAAVGDTELTFITGVYGDDETDFVLKPSAKINVIENVDAELLAATEAVEEYEAADLGDLTKVGEAETLGATATGLVTALPASAEKTALVNRLAVQDAKVLAERKYLEAVEAVIDYEEASLADLTAVGDAKTLGTTAAGLVNALPDSGRKTALLGRITTQDGKVSSAETRLNAEAAATSKVAAYEAGATSAMLTIADVEAAEAKKAAAQTAVDGLTAPESESVKTALQTRIDNRATALTARKEAIALANINTAVNGDINFAGADIKALNIAGVPSNIGDVEGAATLALYNKTVAFAREFIASYADTLDKADLEAIIAVANNFDPDNKGLIKSTTVTGLADAAWVKDLYLERAQEPYLTLDNILRADMDEDGVISAGDITDILILIAKRMQQI